MEGGVHRKEWRTMEDCRSVGRPLEDAGGVPELARVGDLAGGR
jgi:hypothetical protein